VKKRPDPILPYAPPPKSPLLQFRLTRRTCIWLAIAFLILLGAYGFLTGPTSGQIRLDTGDLRYCWYGIPLRYEPMPEPLRTHLLAITSTSPRIPPRWVTVVTYSLRGTNNTDAMCWDFYWYIAVRAKEDPHIARLALDDTVKYIDDTRAESGLPDCTMILSSRIVDRSTQTLDPAWRDNNEVQEYCAAHGYTPPAATTAPDNRLSSRYAAPPFPARMILHPSMRMSPPIRSERPSAQESSVFTLSAYSVLSQKTSQTSSSSHISPTERHQKTSRETTPTLEKSLMPGFTSSATKIEKSD
jgi:hypothetical protein